MGAFRWFEQRVGRARLMGAYAELSAERVEPGVVCQTSEGAGLVVGELEGESSWRLDCFQAACESAGIGVRVSNDINRELWRHFVSRCAVEVSAAINRCAVEEIGERAEARRMFETLFAEGCAVAAAHGVDLAEGADAQAVLLKFADRVSRLRGDLEKGRPMEVEAFAGELVRLGKEKGVGVAAFERGYGALLGLVRGKGTEI
jgi:2-dehydropantoate 2-reductase